MNTLEKDDQEILNKLFERALSWNIEIDPAEIADEDFQSRIYVMYSKVVFVAKCLGELLAKNHEYPLDVMQLIVV